MRVEWQPRDEVLARLRARYRAAQWKSDPERYAAWLALSRFCDHVDEKERRAE